MTVLLITMIYILMCNTSMGSTDQLERELRAALADKKFAKEEKAAGEHALTQAMEKRNQVQDINIRPEQELKGVKAQLSSTLEEKQRLKRGMFSMSLIPSSPYSLLF